MVRATKSPKAEKNNGGKSASTVASTPSKPLQPAAATTPTAAPLTQFGQFRILPVNVTPITAYTSPLPSFAAHSAATSTPTQPIPAVHYLFIRAHEPRKPDPSLPAGRTLFIANVPTDATSAHFARLFRRCGVVERVAWGGGGGVGVTTRDGVRRTGGHAHVVFKQHDAVENAVGMKSRARVWSAESVIEEDKNDDDDDVDPAKAAAAKKTTTVLNGLAKYLAVHYAARPTLATLAAETNSTLAAFEDAERAARAAIESARNVPDADGFVTVVRGRGRKGMNSDGQGASVTAARAEDLKKLKPKKKELVDFYRFQLRENKRNQLADLRRKFEDDKQKIAALRANRRFNPY
ncbi:ribosomal RNA-processing protein 7-domain-containing protein [Geranomyces variabilis]|nr:ribosomal RNA-processing protein 7-domain-containing protein [Geranomyces variabilis]KAJ3142756.1 Ribosomal RNA-processing protein 7 [Geranomyces variabilis]